jgi:hypothetical protein
MAEPATTPPVIAGPQRDVLLATKLHVPPPRPGLVARPRLDERLGQGMGRELVLVCTPAGFGKTTLLAVWVRAGQRPVAWLSLDEGDNDPPVLARYRSGSTLVWHRSSGCRRFPLPVPTFGDVAPRRDP